MKVTQLRNATVVLEFGEYGLLIDPSFCKSGTLPPLRLGTWPWKRNPLVDLPACEDVLSRVTHCLITHRHFDHIDGPAIQWLKSRRTPVYCTRPDLKFLKRKGLDTKLLSRAVPNAIPGGQITPVPALHGPGFLGMLMGPVSGFFLELANEPSVYLASDTIMNREVRAVVEHFQPDVSVIPAGGARFDFGPEIIMGLEQAVEFATHCQGKVVANHLEALDHCRVTREALERRIHQEGLGERFFVPADGESLVFLTEV